MNKLIMVLESLKNSNYIIEENMWGEKELTLRDCQGIVHEVRRNNEFRSQYYDMHRDDRKEKQEELQKAIEILAQYMDEKNKSGLMNKLFK